MTGVILKKGQQEEKLCCKIEGGEKGAKVFRKGEVGASSGSRADKIGKEY